MSLQNKPFSWIFAAFFEDGSTVLQGENDHIAESNQFKLVLERLDELVAFELRNVDGSQVVTVDLLSGNFVVNGTPICIHNQHFDPMGYKLELVYFREVRVERNVQSTVQKDGSITDEITGEDHYVNRYFVGWKTKVNGKDKQVTLAVG